MTRKIRNAITICAIFAPMVFMALHIFRNGYIDPEIKSLTQIINLVEQQYRNIFSVPITKAINQFTHVNFNHDLVYLEKLTINITTYYFFVEVINIACEVLFFPLTWWRSWTDRKEKKL